MTGEHDVRGVEKIMSLWSLHSYSLRIAMHQTGKRVYGSDGTSLPTGITSRAAGDELCKDPIRALCYRSAVRHRLYFELPYGDNGYERSYMLFWGRGLDETMASMEELERNGFEAIVGLAHEGTVHMAASAPCMKLIVDTNPPCWKLGLLGSTLPRDLARNCECQTKDCAFRRRYLDYEVRTVPACGNHGGGSGDDDDDEDDDDDDDDGGQSAVDAVVEFAHGVAMSEAAMLGELDKVKEFVESGSKCTICETLLDSKVREGGVNVDDTFVDNAKKCVRKWVATHVLRDRKSVSEAVAWGGQQAGEDRGGGANPADKSMATEAGAAEAVAGPTPSSTAEGGRCVSESRRAWWKGRSEGPLWSVA